jgi:hypothetical protein
MPRPRSDRQHVTVRLSPEEHDYLVRHGGPTVAIQRLIARGIAGERREHPETVTQIPEKPAPKPVQGNLHRESVEPRPKRS